MALALAGVVLMLISAGPASAYIPNFGNPGFCSPKKPVRDFGFSKLPPVLEVPESAKGLGHGAVIMYSGSVSWVMPEPAPFSYRFSEYDYSGSVLLNWTITAQLWTVGGRGAEIRKVDKAKLFIGRLNLDGPYIAVDPLENRRGFYRFDMQIANKGGEVIGSYSTYFKVVRPSWRPKLGLTRDVLQPGQRLLIRMENHGSEAISYVEPFEVQRFEEGQWVTVPDLAQGPWRMWLGSLGPGSTGRCNGLKLPADIPLGRYRIVKGAGRGLVPKGQRVQITAPFEVVGPAGGIEY